MNQLNRYINIVTKYKAENKYDENMGMFLLSFLILTHASAEMVCNDETQSSEFQTCSVQQSQDPSQCETLKDPIIESTGAEIMAMSCDDHPMGVLSKKTFNY